MIDPRTPILVGCGQITDTKGAPSSDRSRVDFCAEAASLALEDTRAAIGGHALGHHVDAIVVMEFFSDISPRFASPFGRCTNPPKGVANRLGAEGEGMRQNIAAHCDALARLPIREEMESLNVSNAAAIALYAVATRS